MIKSYRVYGVPLQNSGEPEFIKAVQAKTSEAAVVQALVSDLDINKFYRLDTLFAWEDTK